MLDRRVLIICALLGTISLTESGPSSLWGEKVFPDDEQWLSALANRRYAAKKTAEESKYHKSDKVCPTKECKTMADEFLGSLNRSVNPCDDFYEFTCSGWATNNPIPPSLPAWSRYMMFQQTVHHRIKRILETEPVPSDILPVRQAKKWYRSCMDTETLEERGVKPIESILNRAGGWPIAMDEDEWDDEENPWQEVENDYIRLTAAYTFFELHASPAFASNTTYGRIMIGPPELPLSEQMPLKFRNYSGNDYDEYAEFVAGVAYFFVEANRADVTKERLIKEAREIVEFEKKIHELTNFGRRSQFTFEEFIDWWDNNGTSPDKDPKKNINWQSMIQTLFDTVNIKVHPETKIFIYALGYLTDLDELLKKTPTRTIVNYIHWKFVANTMTYTTEAARDILYVLLMEEFGIKKRPPRWSECVNEMKMVDAAGYAFVNEYITKDTENSVLNMSKNIQIAMGEEIEKSTWLDDQSKKLAKEKLEHMRIFVGFPDWYKDKKAVVKSYKGLSIGTEYFDNALSYLKYSNKVNLKRYAAMTEEDDPWLMDPITVNAVYGPMENSLNIPAADFQAPLFTPQMPEYINYGIVGVIVGHEIGHGFDDTGIMFDKDGDRAELPEHFLKSYYQRADCFTDQYDKYYGETKPPETTGSTEEPDYSDMRKAEITKGENIADSTGLQTVFEAYRKVKKERETMTLPGLEEYTDEQLFFIAFGAMWCGVETPEFHEKKEASVDPHSPAKLRVIGAISNTKAFAEIFNCPAGSPMNPHDKCSIWGESKSETEPALRAWIGKKANRWEGQWRI